MESAGTTPAEEWRLWRLVEVPHLHPPNPGDFVDSLGHDGVDLLDRFHILLQLLHSFHWAERDLKGLKAKDYDSRFRFVT